ncbi:MAG: hypothetical protein JWR47_1012 [Phenylobacterium sp.]|jgi:hypothetical protein|nr:hypothetical protein [Phenylobacterium sp.]MDB5434755.1 hypothetical protein [Phenylobacterium sp.]MDB5464714.1 hypothetical protein [Phenylobacterium sp.]MDB5498661.1 hypothetical protein [Phenylobacterium sp.]
MDVRSSLFVNVRRSGVAAQFLASVGACAMLSACVGNPFKDAKVDPRSPIAAEVARTVRSDAPYPTFAGIPPVPKDVRPHKQYGQAAAQIEQTRADVVRATGDDSWTLNNSETFADQARSAAGPELAPAQQSDTEAFAKDLRKRATPPPPPPR